MADPATSTTPTNTASKAPAAAKKKKPPVKRKKAAKSKSAAAATALLNSSAKAQYKKLLEEREAAINDAAWLSKAPSPNEENTTTDFSEKLKSPSFLDHDFEIVQKALLNNGLTMEDVTIESFDILLEQARRYAMVLITDAADYAIHCHGNEGITVADIELAREMQSDNCMGQSSSDNLEQLSRIANETNRKVLPPIPEHCYNGVVLPDLEYTLLGRTYDVVCRSDEKDKAADRKSSEDNDMMVEGHGAASRDQKGVPSFGAKRGSKQVQINITSTNLDGESKSQGMDTS